MHTDEYLRQKARAMIEADVSCAAGRGVDNSLAGSLLSLEFNVPRWAAEAAVRAAVARGFRFGGARVSIDQMAYLEYVAAHPGCCIADVDRACRRDRSAGHQWVYASVRRLARRGLVSVAPGPGNRVTLRLPSMDDPDK